MLPSRRSARIAHFGHASNPPATTPQSIALSLLFSLACLRRSDRVERTLLSASTNAAPEIQTPARLRYNVCLLTALERPYGKGTMPTDVVMPQMGESIFEGTITKWLKKTGDKVQRDEPLFEISTDKVDAEIPAPTSGILQEIKVSEGNTVQVNTVVGVIG